MTFLQQMWSIQERAVKAIIILVIIFLVCNSSSLGLSNHELSDLNFNASSSFSPFAPRDARLYANTSWANEGYSSEEFLQISFHPYSKLITGVATQGNPIMIGGFIVTISSTALMVFRGRFTRLRHIPDHER